MSQVVRASPGLPFEYPPSVDRPPVADERVVLLAVVEDEVRIAGRLNDTVIRHIFRAGLTLHTIRQGLGTNPEMTARVDGAIEELDAAISALRACVFEGPTKKP